MPSVPSAPQPEQVAAFFQKHRTGLVALVFTDLVDSTALLSQLGDQAGTSFLRKRRELIRDTLRTLPEAEEIETAGDSFLLAFAKPSDAVRFALSAQARLRGFSAESRLPVQERMGIHLGEVVISEHETEVKAKDLYGIQLATCARVMSLAQGGQVLLTRGAFDSARQVLKGEDLAGVGPLSWVSHGPYLLKGIEEPVEVCEVGEVGQSPLSAPKTSEKAQRQVRPDEEPVLGWRPAVGQEVPNAPWVLEQKLGEGGFGEVWVAHHPKLKERRVFKFCFRADRVRALKRELTLFRLLKEHVGDHPNIVRLHEVYLEEAPFYLEEEYVEGKDLRTWCEAQGGIDKVPLETRLEIVAQAAEALQAAHDAGIIHRDVKPGNILVSGDLSGTKPLVVKLTDFGIGQVISGEYLKGVTQAGFTQTMLGGTSTGTGTTMYLAPEIVAGTPATTRSDIYSLGVVLFQLVVGDFRHPLTADWMEELTDELLRDDLKRCLTWRVTDRFAGAAQLAKCLKGLEERRVESVARERAERRAAQRHRVAVLAGGAAVMLFLVAVALGYGFSSAEKQRRRAEAYLYDADMNLAGQALQQNNFGRALSFLNYHRPANTGQRDLRGWEWRYLWQKCQSDELATLGQHDGIVQSVAVSPDGKWVASGAWDGLLKIWALASEGAGRRSITNLQLGGGPVSSVAFSSDGRWLAAATWTNGFTLLQAPGWRLEMTVTNLETQWYVGCSLAFSSDSRLLAVGGEVWSVDSRTRLRAWPCQRFESGEPVIAWLPNSQTLAGFGWSNGLFRVSLFDAGSTHPDATVAVTPLQTKRNPATLAFSPDGNHLAVGCWDNTVRIHAAKDWRQVNLLTNHTGWVSSLAFSPDGQWLASGSADHSIKIWRTRDWQVTTTLRGHLEEVWTVAFTPDGQRLVTGSKDHSVRLWPVTGRSRPIQEIPLPTEGTRRSSLSGLCPFTVGPSNMLTVWDGQTLEVRKRISSYPTTNVLHAVPSPDGRFLAMVTAEGGLSLMDLSPGAVSPPVCLRTNGPSLLSGAFSDQVKWLAFSDGKTLAIWNLKHHPPRPGVALGAGNFFNLCFSQDERFLGAVTGPLRTERTVVVWELDSGKEMARFHQPHRDEVRAISFSPDGTMLATASWDNTCKLFDLRERREITTLRGQLLALHAVCFSPDGRRLAVGTGDGGVNIWDLETGREVLVLSGQRDQFTPVWAVRFHPSGDSLLSIDWSALRLWRAPSWAEIDAAEKARAAGPPPASPR